VVRTFRRPTLIVVAALLALGLAGCAQLHAAPTTSGTTGASSATTASSSPDRTAVPVRPAVASSHSSTAPSESEGARVQARIESIRHSLDGSRVADFAVGAYRGKNVILIQVESLNGFLIGNEYGGQEVTPNLNKLIKSSWYWPNTFSQTGLGNTVDAEFIANTSLYAPQDQASTVKYANRVIPGLPRVLRGAGYDSFTIHPNAVLFWNRKQMYEGLGFNRYYDAGFFRGADTMGEYGSSDEELFKRGAKLLRALDASGTPFYAQFITLSAHAPFISIPESRQAFRAPEELIGSLIGDYLPAEGYSDLAIGKFIKDLKASGVWDNSIVVIYGDHTGMLTNKLGGRRELVAKQFLGRSYGPVDRQRIPLIIHLPGQTKPVRRTDVAGQVDIMPTIADLVGADLAEVPHTGRSLFVNSGSLVPLNAYLPGDSFVNSKVLFMPGKGSEAGSAQDVFDGSARTPSAQDKADLVRVRDLMRISESYLLGLEKFDGGEQGWIPDSIARKAAKPYGFLQRGKGVGSL